FFLLSSQRRLPWFQDMLYLLDSDNPEIVTATLSVIGDPRMSWNSYAESLSGGVPKPSPNDLGLKDSDPECSTSSLPDEPALPHVDEEFGGSSAMKPCSPWE